MSGKLSRTVLRRGKGSNPFSLVDYTSHAYFSLTEQYGMKQSMSRKGNCWDNACAENFFGHLKEEFVRFYKLQTFKEAREVIDDYIDFYNNERILLKTELTPMESRYQFCA